MRRNIDSEQEKSRPLYPVEAAEAISILIEDSREILKLLDRMGSPRSSIE